MTQSDQSFIDLAKVIDQTIRTFGCVILEPIEVFLIGMLREHPKTLKSWTKHTHTASIEELAELIKLLQTQGKLRLPVDKEGTEQESNEEESGEEHGV